VSEELGRIAVFYHYFEADAVYRDNLIFFLSMAPESADLFLVAAESTLPDLPDIPRLSVIPTRNLNLDWGGYGQAFSKVTGLEAYDALFFINSSVRGPFLSVHDDKSWIRSLTDLLQGDVHLVGTSINHLPESSRYAARYRQLFDHSGPLSHVQTTAYAMTQSAFQHLMSMGFYDVDREYPKEEVIFRYELRLSQEILAKGWNIRGFLQGDQGIDYRQPHEDSNFAAVGGDPLRPFAFFGRTASPIEALFIKTNRSLLETEALTSWTYTALRSVRNPAILSWAPYKDLITRCEALLRAAALTREHRRIGRFRRFTRWLKQKGQPR
jgi:hypothetical protein